jgi:opacity protein-like surface antigen
MLRKTKKIMLALILSLGFTSVSWAVLPEVYIGAGYVQKKSIIDTNSDGSDEKFNNQSYLISLGVRPLGFLPILGNFRVEAQNLGALSGSNKDTQYGLVLYYDILRIIPIVNPYVGMGVQYATYNFDNTADFYDKKSKGLYTLHAGLNASIPALPLDLYVEYRYTTTTSNSSAGALSYDIKSNDFMIGARYYILK